MKYWQGCLSDTLLITLISNEVINKYKSSNCQEIQWLTAAMMSWLAEQQLKEAKGFYNTERHRRIYWYKYQYYKYKYKNQYIL